MTEKGLAFYGELERTWQELADAVQVLTQPITPSDHEQASDHENQTNQP
jgi:PadR family transcriptional regulator PadR